jgi:nicotinamidase-related amidase
MPVTPAKSARSAKTGLGALLTPDDCALLLIDHQPFQFAGLRSHDPQTVVNNVVGLAKTAKLFGVPTLLSTVTAARGGHLLKPLQAVHPEQMPIDRTTINAWEDPRVVAWVEGTRRTKIVMAGLWTEICLAMPTIQAIGEGYDVYIVTDASGGVSLEAHEVAVQRMVQVGAVPITWGAFAGELQRDWARTATVAALGDSIVDHWGAVGTSLLWEQQLLGSATDAQAHSDTSGNGEAVLPHALSF